MFNFRLDDIMTMVTLEALVYIASVQLFGEARKFGCAPELGKQSPAKLGCFAVASHSIAPSWSTRFVCVCVTRQYN